MTVRTIDALKLMVDNLELERNGLIDALQLMVDDLENNGEILRTDSARIEMMTNTLAKVGEPLKGNDDE